MSSTGGSSNFFDFKSRDRPENVADGSDSMASFVGFFQNRNAFKSSLLTLIYFILSALLWHHTYQANDVIFDRTFRSMHVIPKSMVNHASGYWTFDWLTHPFRVVDGMTGDTSVQSGNVVPALCMHDVDECFEWKSTTVFPTVKAECQTSSANQKKGKFSCAMTRNQTRYAAGLYNSHCASLPTKFEKVACQMQRSADVDVVVNDDKSYSMSSGHSKAVLMFYVTVILFVVNLFNFFESTYWMKPTTPDGTFNYSKAKDVQSLKKYVAIFIFVLLVFHRGFYATQAQTMGIEAPMPNGTFFYGLLAYAAVTWFLSFHEVNDNNSESTFSTRTEPNSRSPMEMEPLNKPMELNLAGFDGKKKLRTDAFTQPGNVSGIKRVTDGDADLDLGDVTLDHYKIRPSNSVWAMVNLWVWPLVILSAFITKSNYQLDIELTVVLVGFFFIGLIELFTKRLMELKYLFSGIQTKSGINQKNASLWLGVPLVVLISMVVQITTLAVVFWTANWSFGKSGYDDSGVFTIGDPEKSKRREYIGLVKTLYLVYFIFVQVYKLMANVTVGTSLQKMTGKNIQSAEQGGNTKRNIYMNMDGWLFSLLNLSVLIIVTTFLGQAGLDGNDIGYYDAGVYLKAVASQIS